MLLILKKDHIEFTRLRALAQSFINKEKGPEAFDEFRRAAFPWVETQQKRDQQATIKILQDEIKKGALAIKGGLWDNTPTRAIKSRLRTKVVEADSAPRTPPAPTTPEMKQLFKKIGSTF